MGQHLPVWALNLIDDVNHLGRKPYKRSCWSTDLCVWVSFQLFLKDYRWDPEQRVYVARM